MPECWINRPAFFSFCRFTTPVLSKLCLVLCFQKKYQVGSMFILKLPLLSTQDSEFQQKTDGWASLFTLLGIIFSTQPEFLFGHSSEHMSQPEEPLTQREFPFARLIATVSALLASAFATLTYVCEGLIGPKVHTLLNSRLAASHRRML